MKATKIIVSLLLILSLIGALSSCGVKGTDATTTSGKSVDETTRETEYLTDAAEDEPTSLEEETEAQPSSLDHYSDVLKSYGNTRITHAVDYDVYIDKTVYEYAIKDINSDGVDELVIREKSEFSSGYVPDDFRIGAIYTLDKNNTPVELYFVTRHGDCTVSADGYFIETYHGATIEKLVDTELVLVAESDRFGADYENERDEFLRANNVSTEEMKFDYIPYNG
ncbi:MAG: hypothetical protein K5756_02580 [Clostridiales bacterium]|nr:hypothetical protein [Clostridiales bacterium]